MTNLHPDENEIQNYILDSTRNLELIEHLLQCKSCSLKAEQYKQLFAEIHRQETPAFEFNLTKLVMEQLPQPKPKFSVDKYLNHIIVSLIVMLCLGLLYFLSLLLPNILLNVTPILIYLIITVVVCISGAIFLDMYRKHQEQMGVINFY
ncbi:MAG: hypothetical protein ABI760_04325 [Ferruginibacter sp.]